MSKIKILVIAIALAALSTASTLIVFNVPRFSSPKANLIAEKKPETKPKIKPELKLFTGTKLDLVFYGDSRSNPEVHRRIVSQIIKAKPDMVFHLGDFVDDSNSEDEWKTVNDIITPLKERFKFYSVPGNHELESEIYYRYFSDHAQAKWSSIDQDNIHIILLNSNQPLSKGSKQYDWLENDLAANRQAFKVVILHHSLVSVGNHASEELDFKADLINLFSSQDVNLVVSGHEHNYERFLLGDTIYVDTGGGGAALYSQEKEDNRLEKFVEKHNYCQLSFVGPKIWLTAYDDNGEAIDHVNIK